jgi:hypothetical protein
MKRTLALFVLMAFGFVVGAQTYIGTMEVDGYKREDVKVTLRVGTNQQSPNVVELTMYRVKFSWLMPVKIDFDIPQMKLENGRLTADGVVPVSDGKRYEKYTIHNLSGAVSEQKLIFQCRMGDKPFFFSGERKNESSK